MPVKPIPDGYHSVTPYLTVPDVEAEIDFLQKAFGATKNYSHDGPDGRIVHAEVKVGDSMVMIGRPRPPRTPKPCTLYVYTEKVDDWYKSAVQAGGKSISEPADQFYGDRHGAVEDSNGNEWWIATHIEDVSPDELDKRMAAMTTK